jgi:hypothetical protein
MSTNSNIVHLIVLEVDSCRTIFGRLFVIIFSVLILLYQPGQAMNPVHDHMIGLRILGTILLFSLSKICKYHLIFGVTHSLVRMIQNMITHTYGPIS